jgi:hypothetical protein
MTPQAKPKRLPKLPDVWVAFDGVTQTTPEEVRFYKFPRGVRYTPSKPRKAQVCRWIEHPMVDGPTVPAYDTQCGQDRVVTPFDASYCAWCGNRIKRVKS